MSNYKSLYTSLFKEDPPLILGSCEDNREVFVGMEDVQAGKLPLHHQCCQKIVGMKSPDGVCQVQAVQTFLRY